MKKAIGILALGMLFYVFLLPVPAQIDMSGGLPKVNEIIIFRVKIVADQHYQTKSRDWRGNYYLDDYDVLPSENWKIDLVDLIECVNKEMERGGIRVKFEVAEISEWQAKEKPKTIDELLDDIIAKIPIEKHDLVIGLTAFTFPFKSEKAGLCSYRNYILVRDYSPFIIRDGAMFRDDGDSWTLAILLHEIGHFLLGPSHSDNPESIMNGKWQTGFKKEFLWEEIELINKNAAEVCSRLHRGISNR